jgi:23S rRNA (uridine2552-2'-O)-methyltransferase
MGRSKSSRRWLTEHFNDPYVKKAQQEGHRSRAAYKLLEIQAKDKLLKSGMAVVDLGAAPGGWSVVAQKLVGESGHIFALDILPMDPVPGVEFIQGDFTEQEVFDKLVTLLGATAVDVVISDMAPNTSGMTAVDQPRMIYLAELALDFAEKALKPKGNFLVKVFQGEGFDEFLKQVRSRF